MYFSIKSPCDICEVPQCSPQSFPNLPFFWSQWTSFHTGLRAKPVELPTWNTPTQHWRTSQDNGLKNLTKIKINFKISQDGEKWEAQPSYSLINTVHKNEYETLPVKFLIRLVDCVVHTNWWIACGQNPWLFTFSNNIHALQCHGIWINSADSNRPHNNMQQRVLLHNC